MDIEPPLRTHILDACFDGQPPVDFDDDYDLIDSGHIDSLRIMGLVTFVEQRWQLRFGATDLVPEHFRSVAAMAAYVRGRLAQA
jgi:acyl carrier protein